MSLPMGNRNCEPTTTPLTYSRNDLKVRSRKLWQKKDRQIDHEKCIDYGTAEKDIWDLIDSPQFVDFSDLQMASDSFFSKSRVIMSTPKPNSEYENSANSYNDNTMIESLKNVSLSEIHCVSPIQNTIVKVDRELSKEVSELYDTAIRMDTTKPQACNEEKNLQQKCEQQAKPECVVKPWKRPPFIPNLTKKNPEKPKPPSLRTTIRAEQRKLFNATLKEKEKEREEHRRMMAAKKTEEEKEIALMRKQTVHKAQPIRKYMELPKLRKRPLTNPVTPLLLKRRRIGTENQL